MTILGTDRASLTGPEYEQLVERLSVEERPIDDEIILEVMDEIDGCPKNGGALLRKFEIVDDDGVFEYVSETPNASRYSLLQTSGFLHDFLRSKELNESIEGLNTENGFSGYHWKEKDGEPIGADEEQELDWYHSLHVDGYLAWVMCRGGAYESFGGTQAEAKSLGRQFDQAVINDRYEDFFAWRIPNKQWSEWFIGVIHWDETLLLVDKEKKVIWLFMFTSTS